MKKILLLAILFSSCYEYYNIKLPNGSIVNSTETYGRSFHKGDTVCIHYVYQNWYIDNGGNMTDTTILFSDGSSTTFKIGIIK